MVIQAVDRFKEVAGIKESLQKVQTFGMFEESGHGTKTLHNWEIKLHKSMLAATLLRLIEVCIYDSLPPDYNLKAYKQFEDPLASLMVNLGKPAMANYTGEVQRIIQALLIVSKGLSPTLCDTLDGMVALLEGGDIEGSDRTLALFISHGSDYLSQYPDLFVRICDIMAQSYPSDCRYLCLQLLFLNNFNEKLALKVTDVLESLF